MSKADLLRLLELVPYRIAASAVVAALALYELLAPNPRSRARRGSRPGSGETKHSRAGLSVERRRMSSGKRRGKPTGPPVSACDPGAPDASALRQAALLSFNLRSRGHV